jgi:hypothetical protein
MNLSVYAANLRAIECPKEVVVQIIRTVANEDFTRRRHAQFTPLHARFWDLIAQGGDSEPNGAVGTELTSNALDANRLEKLEAALGPNWSREVEALLQKGYFQPTLSFLPQETQQRWMELDENFTRQQQDILRQTRGDPAVQKAQLEALVHERDDLRRQLLTNEQFEEYTERTAANAGWAQSLAGFEATEAEYRALNRLRGDTPTNQVSAFNAQAQALLGADRFTEFLRAQDPRFHEMLTLVTRCQLPMQTVERIHQERVAAEREAALVGGDLTRSADDRSALLNALQFETRLQLLAILGQTAGEAYLRHHGDWLAAITLTHQP